MADGATSHSWQLAAGSWQLAAGSWQLAETTAYFIVAEALTDLVNHAGARTTSVKLAINDAQLYIEVRDDGAGGADPSQGSGCEPIHHPVSARSSSHRRSVGDPGSAWASLTTTTESRYHRSPTLCVRGGASSTACRTRQIANCLRGSARSRRARSPRQCG
jgi:hypothetical protein